MMDAIEQAAEALARLSDAEWLQLKSAEDHRRAQQQIIRDLSSARARELRRKRGDAA